MCCVRMSCRWDLILPWHTLFSSTFFFWIEDLLIFFLFYSFCICWLWRRILFFIQDFFHFPFFWSRTSGSFHRIIYWMVFKKSDWLPSSSTHSHHQLICSVICLPNFNGLSNTFLYLLRHLAMFLLCCCCYLIISSGPRILVSLSMTSFLIFLSFISGSFPVLEAMSRHLPRWMLSTSQVLVLHPMKRRTWMVAMDLLLTRTR